MATDTLELEPDAFWQMVTKDNLKVDGPSAGYMWAGRQGKAGWEMYKTRAMPIGWLYQARRVLTAPAGGGAMIMQVAIPTGTTARVIAYNVIGPASAGATLQVSVVDEDGNRIVWLNDLAAGASRSAFGPGIGQAGTTNANLTNSVGLILGPGQTFYASASTSLQTETMTLGIVLLLSRADGSPTWSATVNAVAVDPAASTISTANTLQAVYL